MNKFLYTLLFLLIQTIGSAQIIEHYFNDQEQKDGGEIYTHIKYENSIIIGGKSFDSKKYNPAVIRIDTSGNTIWNTNDTTTYNTYGGGSVGSMILSGGYIYAFMFYDANTYPYAYKNEIWKIDVTNGYILWKKPFHSSVSNLTPRMVDFDTDKFLLEYSDQLFNAQISNYVYTVNYAFIDKQNGDTLSTHSMIKNRYAAPPLAVDSKKNIYYTLSDSIFKVSGDVQANLIWKASYTTINDKILYDGIYIDSVDNIYLFGSKESGSELGRVTSVDKDNGARIWDVATPYDNIDMTFQDMVDKKGFLYVAWSTKYSGGIKTNAWTSKIGKSTGTLAWFSSKDYFDDAQQFYGLQSTISLDTDDYGDVYVTGYYNSDNPGPAKWGILKLDGTTGNVVYRRGIVYQNNAANNTREKLDIGLVTCVFNNKPYFLGKLKMTDLVFNNRTKLVFVKLNSLTGNTEIQKFIEGNYKFPSVTIDIVDYPSSQTLVLKQLGRSVIIEMYNASKNILWSKTFKKEYFLTGKNLTVGPNGDIYFSAMSSSENNAYPYYLTGSDSAYVYQLSSAGDIIKTYSLGEKYYSLYPVELYADNSKVMFFYSKTGGDFDQNIEGVFYYRKIESLTMSAENLANFTNRKRLNSIHNYFSKDEDKAYFFSNYRANNVIELNKNSMAYSTIASLYYPFDTVNYVVKVDSDHALICANSRLRNGAIGLYDFNKMDTVWTKLIPSYNSAALKSVLGSADTSAYIMISNNSDITIRNISIATGKQIWEYTYNGTASRQDFPLDIEYDKIRDQIIITGYETMSDKTTAALILIIDKSGIALDTIVRKGDYAGYNFALCAHILQDGSQWVGGNLNKNGYGPAGFIYELTGTTTVTDIAQKQNNQNNINIKVSPNPFSTTTTIEVISEQTYSAMTLTLYNLLGEVVDQFTEQHMAAFLINRNKLAAGMYTYQISTGNAGLVTGKLLVVD